MLRISTLFFTLFLLFYSQQNIHCQNTINPTDSIVMNQWANNCTIPGWIATSPIYLWTGVDTINVGGEYRVSKIDLTNQNIGCNIPAGLLDSLLALEELRIRGNFFSVQANSWLTLTHPNLRIVEISENEFSRIPFDELLLYTPFLDTLLAANYINQFSVNIDPYPSFFHGNLKRLDISNNKYSGIFDLNFYPALNSILQINNNFFVDFGLPTANFNGPYLIDMSYNDLTGLGPIRLLMERNAKFERLHARNATDNSSAKPFLNVTPSNFANNTFTSMHIDLGENNLSGAANITAFSFNVKVLLIDNNSITNLNITAISNSLEVFDAAFNQISFGTLDMFEKIPNIRILKYNDNQMSGMLPVPSNAATYPLAKIEVLDLSNNNLHGAIELFWLLKEQEVLNSGVPLPMSVEVLNFANNKFRKIKIDTNTTIAYSNLNKFAVENNFLDFFELYKAADMFSLNYTTVSGSFYQHYILPGAPLDSLAYSYGPQKEVGIGGVKRRSIGGIVSFDVEIGEPPAFLGDYNQYIWRRVDSSNIITEDVSSVNYFGASVIGNALNGNGILNTSINLPGSAQVQGRSHLIMQNLASGTHDGWKYQLCASNDRFPLLEACNVPKKMVLGECFDSLGQPINCQQFMVEVDPSATQTQLDSLKDELGVHTLETCMCGSIELWELNDTTNMIDVEAYGTGTRSTAGSSSTKAELLSADVNHDLLGTSILTGDNNPSAPSGTTHTSPTIVAIIDSGTDIDHPSLTNRIWINTSDNSIDGVDDDLNCLVDDANGYNFLEDSSTPYDDHGHGTNVAGIVGGLALGAVAPNGGSYDSLAILPLKFTNKKGDGTCFHAACALRYAADYSSINGDIVRVVNASWGYYGEENYTLKEQLRYAADNCDMLFITSAGNDGTDNDIIPHYPSNFDLDNVIVVAAHDPILVNNLSGYSNFGQNNVDLAARGQFTTTKATILNLSETEIATGTSFATAQVSRAAGLLFHEFPNASYRAVKAALMEGAVTLNNADSAKVKSGGRLDYPAARVALLANANRTACMPSIDIKIRLEGAIDTASAIGLMHDDLVQSGVFPSAQPFNRLPWNYTGTESVTPLTGPFIGNDAIVDWVLVLVSASDTSFAEAMLLQRDGDVVNTSGGLLELPNLVNESYKVTVIHRNHLGVETVDYEYFEHPVSSFNFADTSASAIPLTATTKDLSQWRVLVTGDASADGQVNAVDKNAFIRPRIGSSGYENADLNLDGRIDAADYALWLLNNSIQTECVNCYIKAP